MARNLCNNVKLLKNRDSNLLSEVISDAIPSSMYSTGNINNFTTSTTLTLGETYCRLWG
jgi:hypothetical protein